MHTDTSQVTQFRQTQALQEQASKQGMTGYAAVACHEVITAKMERGAQRLLQLFQQGRHEEAVRLMETPAWSLEGEECLRCLTMTQHEGQSYPAEFVDTHE